jgi:hypothetical protein
MRTLILSIMLSCAATGQQPTLEKRDGLSVLANVVAVWHLVHAKESRATMIALDSGAALNPIGLYLVVTSGNGPESVVKIWNVGVRLSSVQSVKITHSDKEASIEATAETEDASSGRRAAGHKVAYLLRWRSLAALSGFGGTPLVRPELQTIESPDAGPHKQGGKED